MPPLTQHRNTAATAGDDDLICIQKRPDRINLYDILRLRCRYDPAIALARLLGYKISFFFLCLSLFLRHIAADDLDGLCKGIIIGIHHHLGNDGADGLRDSSSQKLLPDGILQVIADIALAHGRANRHRCKGIFFMLFSELIESGMNHTDLGRIAVADGYLTALLHQICDGLCGTFDCYLLLRQGRSQGFMSQSNYYFFLFHNPIPRFIFF